MDDNNKIFEMDNVLDLESGTIIELQIGKSTSICVIPNKECRDIHGQKIVIIDLDDGYLWDENSVVIGVLKNKTYKILKYYEKK